MFGRARGLPSVRTHQRSIGLINATQTNALDVPPNDDLRERRRPAYSNGEAVVAFVVYATRVRAPSIISSLCLRLYFSAGNVEKLLTSPWH